MQSSWPLIYREDRPSPAHANGHMPESQTLTHPERHAPRGGPAGTQRSLCAYRKHCGTDVSAGTCVVALIELRATRSMVARPTGRMRQRAPPKANTTVIGVTSHWPPPAAHWRCGQPAQVRARSIQLESARLGRGVQGRVDAEARRRRRLLHVEHERCEQGSARAGGTDDQREQRNQQQLRLSCPLDGARRRWRGIARVVLVDHRRLLLDHVRFVKCFDGAHQPCRVRAEGAVA